MSLVVDVESSKDIASFYKGAFQQIATLRQGQSRLAILAKDALVSPKAGEGIYARAFAAKTAARLRTHIVFSLTLGRVCEKVVFRLMVFRICC